MGTTNPNGDRRCSIRAKAGGGNEGGWDNLFCTVAEATDPKKPHILGPLRLDKRGVIFPYTPTVSFSTTANWSGQSFSHSNYTFNSWENSEISEITVIGDFTATTEEEAKYVLAVSHFLKGSTKGGFGRIDPEKGVPPGVYNFNYLGDYQFKNIPVVVTSAIFNYEPGVDYVPVALASGGGGSSWVPVKQSITVTLKPQYNIEKLRNKFSLKKFRDGSFLTGSEDKPGTGGGFL